MIEFGKELRTAREAKGLTIGQVAESTRMSPSTIEELEAEDFSHIAAPIYGRGFVKLYCEAVGLEPKPFVDEFMDLFNGKHDNGIKERPLREPPVVQTAAENPPPAAPGGDLPPPAAAPQSLFDFQRTSHPSAASVPQPVDSIPSMAVPQTLQPCEPESVPPPNKPAAPAFATPRHPTADAPIPPPLAAATTPREPRASAGDATISRYAAPVRPIKVPVIVSSYWRIGLIAVAILIVLSLIAYGFRALYRATSPQTEPSREDSIAETGSAPAASEKEPEKPASADAKPASAVPKEARTPQKIPSLYID